MEETRQRIGASDYRLGEVRCEECGREAPLFAAGWRVSGQVDAYRDELPALSFCCPDCATAGQDAN